MEDYYDSLARIFSEAAPIYDKKILSNFVNVHIRSIEMSVLLSFHREGMRALEIGCGTGEEASKFILKTGSDLTCLEISRGMVDYASRKMENLGILEKFHVVVGAASSVGKMEHSFDLIYSFNGALNTEPLIGEAATGLHEALKSGGILIFSLRNRLCLGEAIIYTLLGKFHRIRERMSDVTYVEVVGRKVGSRYYSPSEITSIFRNFKLLRKRGLAIVLPPYLAERIRSDALKGLIVKLDSILSSIPVFSSLGDEIIYVFKRE